MSGEPEQPASLDVAAWRHAVAAIRRELQLIDQELSELPVGQSRLRMAARDRKRHAKHELGIAIRSLARAEGTDGAQAPRGPQQ